MFILQIFKYFISVDCVWQDVLKSIKKKKKENLKEIIATSFIQIKVKTGTKILEKK